VPWRQRRYRLHSELIPQACPGPAQQVPARGPWSGKMMWWHSQSQSDKSRRPDLGTTWLPPSLKLIRRDPGGLTEWGGRTCDFSAARSRVVDRCQRGGCRTRTGRRWCLRRNPHEQRRTQPECRCCRLAYSEVRCGLGGFGRFLQHPGSRPFDPQGLSHHVGSPGVWRGALGASARSVRVAQLLRGAQVLVDGLAADAELTGQCCLRGTVAGPLVQFGHLLLAEGPPAAAVGAAFLGQLDPFALPFADSGHVRELRERITVRRSKSQERSACKPQIGVTVGQDSESP
jgi:hypothetical protein